MARLLLAGYLGCGNLGDDAMMLGLLRGIPGDSEITVLSGNPEDTFRVYGMRSVPRKDFKAIDKAINECDALVFPGGSIFQDVTSVASVGYYNRLVTKAKKAGKKVILLGQGVGPLNRFLGKRMAASAFMAADAIAVRDPSSAAMLKTLGVNRPVRVTADPAFMLPEPPSQADQQGFQVAGMRTVGLAPRPFGKGKDIVVLFSELSRLLFNAKVMPVLIEMDKNEDGPLILEISKHQGGKVPDLRKLATPAQLQTRLSRMDSVIAMRLHAGILATTVGVPSMMVSYDPKINALSKLLDIGPVTAVEGLTPQRLFEGFMTFLKERDRNIKTLERRKEELAKLAYGNVELLVETLRSPVRA
jgi:polysaccharide pyruvyl transferase CsaB